MKNLTFYDTIEILNAVPEILIIVLFYHRILKNKYQSKSTYIIWYGIGFLILAGSSIMNLTPYIRIVITLVILLLTAVFMYIGSNTVKLFASIYYILIVFISETLFVVILTLMNYGDPTELLESSTGRFIGMLGTKILDFWIIVYSYRIYKNKVKSLPLKYWILILLMPILSTVILDLVFPVISAENGVMVFYIIAVVGLLYVNFSVFNYFESYDKQIKLVTLEKILELEDENYRTIESSYLEVRSIKHDLKNQIELLNDLIRKHDYEMAGEYMSNLYNSVEQATSVCYTGNSAIDSIINIKGGYAKSKAINFMTKIKVINIEFDSVKLCRILGNALDNAIEACELVNSNDKSICLVMNQDRNKMIIEINNPSPNVDVHNLTTTKKNAAIHGIGLKSIKQTVTAMNGTMSCIYENGFFSMKIMLVK